jgi:hypothetical protein
MTRPMATHLIGHILHTATCASAGSHNSHGLADSPHSRYFRIAENIGKRRAGSGYGLYVFVVIGLIMGWAQSR